MDIDTYMHKFLSDLRVHQSRMKGSRGINPLLWGVFCVELLLRGEFFIGPSQVDIAQTIRNRLAFELFLIKLLQGEISVPYVGPAAKRSLSTGLIGIKLASERWA